MMQINADVDLDQYEDLVYDDNPSPLSVGTIIQAQLFLSTVKGEFDMKFLKDDEKGISNRPHSDSLYQPIMRSSYSEITGTILKIRSRSPKTPVFEVLEPLSQETDVLLTVNDIPILLPFFHPMDDPLNFREYERKRMHASGRLLCLPSFSTFEIFRPVIAEIKEIWKNESLDRSRDDRWNQRWGTLGLELISDKVVPDISVDFIK